jgi:hypothetical protein
MGCLGVLFSIDEKDVKQLKKFKSDVDRLIYLTILYLAEKFYITGMTI